MLIYTFYPKSQQMFPNLLQMKHPLQPQLLPHPEGESLHLLKFLHQAIPKRDVSVKGLLCLKLIYKRQ